MTMTDRNSIHVFEEDENEKERENQHLWEVHFYKLPKLISEFAYFRDWYFIFHFLQFPIFAYLRFCIFVYLHICVFAFTSELLLYFPISSLSSKSSKHVMGRRMCINLVIKNFVSNFPNIAFEICKTKLPILNKLSPPNTQTQIQNHQIDKYKHTTFLKR